LAGSALWDGEAAFIEAQDLLPFEELLTRAGLVREGSRTPEGGKTVAQEIRDNRSR
jgi:hypothetical protein